MNKARLIIGFIFVSLPATTASAQVAEASTFATPVLLGSNILMRDATGLILLTTGK